MYLDPSFGRTPQPDSLISHSLLAQLLPNCLLSRLPAHVVHRLACIKDRRSNITVVFPLHISCLPLSFSSRRAVQKPRRRSAQPSPSLSELPTSDPLACHPVLCQSATGCDSQGGRLTMGVNGQRLQLTVTIPTPTSQRRPRAPSINFVFVYTACLLQQYGKQE